MLMILAQNKANTRAKRVALTVVASDGELDGAIDAVLIADVLVGIIANIAVLVDTVLVMILDVVDTIDVLFMILDVIDTVEYNSANK